MEDILQEFCGVIEADFKIKDSNPDDLLTTLQEELEVNSHTANHKHVKNFTDYIDKQTFNQTIYKNWEQKLINRVDEIRKRIAKDCQRRLSNYYNHEKNNSKWRKELQQSKKNVQDLARQTANEILH